MTDTNYITATPVRKVVVVNGTGEILGMLDAALEAGRYDMVFVEPGDRAYSQIRNIQPNLVILCTHLEALDGLQLLSMLKLDPDTRDIPVVTYTTEYEREAFNEAVARLVADEDHPLPARPALRMN